MVCVVEECLEMIHPNGEEKSVFHLLLSYHQKRIVKEPWG